MSKENPWNELISKVNRNYTTKDNQYIIKDDLEVVQKFNDNLSQKSKDDFQVYYHMHPYHYTGNIKNASVILLATNPGYVEEEEDTLYLNPKFHEEVIENLKFNTDTFVNKDESRKKDGDYWTEKTRELRKILGDDIVDKNLALIQFFPYHSKKFRKIAKKYFENGEKYLKTQKFGFELVRQAIKNNKLIIILRSQKDWLEAIPELKTHKEKGLVLELNNYRQPYLTQKNIKNNGFEILVNYLKEKNE